LGTIIQVRRLWRREQSPRSVPATAQQLPAESLLRCPICRHQAVMQAFSNSAAAPNMRLCPHCQKQIPLPLLLGQAQRQSIRRR
ncbi:MAG: hypothetical protein PHG44_10605, partial [Lentisphaeria bacterium]|nr:hypothetical protein [Lentisphaeria bacterium]